jgi:hypothetical protein
MTNAEAVIYDPDLDPALDTRPAIRIRLRKAGVPRPKPGEALAAEDLLHDASYFPVERTKALVEQAGLLEAKLKELPDDDEDPIIGVLVEMVVLLLEDSDELLTVIPDAWAADAVSIEYLTRTIGWIQRQQGEREAAGEA